ncbi:MAG TPA: hypothetical protein VFG68_11755 [Fimbriiglobus sp.]|nr:hypothetical protein [Fimbriiglobus sp.]
MTDLLHFGRPRPTEQAVHTRYEKAGLTLYGPPVPWNADAVVVEVLLSRLPPSCRQRADFTLRIPGRDPVPAESVRSDDADGSRHRVFFRLPVPPESFDAEVLLRHRLLVTVPITVLPIDQFLAGLRVVNPTAAVRLGAQAVAAQTFVASQCRGLTAAAVLRSPTGLAPLADLGVTVAFRPDRGAEMVVPVPLTGTQLAGKEALVTAVPAKAPRRSGGYTVAWVVGGRELFAQRLTAVTGRRFIDSLRVSDARFVAADKAGKVKVARQPPPAGEAARLGPCFLLASREPGAAGLLTLQAVAVGTGGGQTPMTLEQQVLVTDGPTAFTPGMVDVGELAGLTGFELRHRGRVLGVLSVSPVPSAAFNAEGSFKPPPDFAWSNTAEDELAERLSKLMGGGENR